MAIVAFNITANTAGFNQAVNNFLNGVTQMNSAVKQLSSSVNQQTSNITTAMSAFAQQTAQSANFLDQNFARSLSRASAQGAGFGATLGVVAVAAVRSLIREMESLGREVITVVRDFELLTFSLQTLSAIELKQSGEFESVSAALGEAEVHAQGYLLYLQDLAIYSPFTTREIAAGNKLLRVYGFLEQEAANLGKVIVDFGSGAGLTEDQLNRIQYAIGQIRAEGRLLARDALQLSNAAVPVLRLVADQYGITVAELQEQMRTGFVPATDALQAVINYMEEFEGSGERVSDTLNGIVSSIKDAAEIGTALTFEALFQNVLPQLGEFRDLVASKDFRASLVVIGEEIGTRIAGAIQTLRDSIVGLISTWNTLPPNIQNGIITFVAATAATAAFGIAVGALTVSLSLLVNPFTLVITTIGLFVGAYVSNFAKVKDITDSVVSAISSMVSGFADGLNSLVQIVGDVTSAIIDQFSATAEAAVEWGTSIVENLALGVTAAVDLVATAISSIASVFTYFMAPGSPPRMLPDLDTWGTQAAEVYLQGWTEADYGIIDTFGNALRGLLRGLVTTGDLKETDLIPTLLGGRQAIAQAIGEIRDTTQVSNETLENLNASFGKVGNEAVRLVSKYQDLANATTTVTQLQKELNDATKEYDRILQPLYNSLNKISGAKQTADEEREILELQRLIASQGVSDTRKESARARIQEIQTQRRIRSIEEERDARLTSVKDQLEKAETVEEKAKSELDLLMERIGAQTTQLDLVKEQAQLMERLRKAAEAAAKRAKKMLTPLEKQLELMKAQQDELKDLIALRRNQYFIENEGFTAAEKANAALDNQRIEIERELRRVELGKLGFDPTLLDDLANVEIVLKDLKLPKGDKVFPTDTGELFFKTQVDLQKQLDEMNAALERAKTRWDELTGSINATTDAINTALPAFLKLRGESGDSPLLTNLIALFGGIAASALVSRIGGITASLLTLRGGLNLLSLAAGITTAAWIGNWFEIREKTERAILAIKIAIGALKLDVLQKAISNLGKTFGEVFSLNKIKSIEDFKNAVSEFISSIREEIGKWIEAIGGWESVNDRLALALAKVKDLLGTLGLINIVPILALATRWVLALSKGFGGLRGVVGLLAPIFSTLGQQFLNIFRLIGIGSIGSVTSIGTIAKAVLGFVTKMGPWGLAIGAAVLAWQTNFLGFRDIVKNILGEIGIDVNKLSESFGVVGDVFQRIVDSIKLAFAKIREGGLGAIGEVIPELLSNIGESISQGVSQIGPILSEAFAGISSVFSEGFNLETVTQFASNIVAAFIEGFGEFAGNFLRWTIGTAIPSVLSGFGAILTSVFNFWKEVDWSKLAFNTGQLSSNLVTQWLNANKIALETVIPAVIEAGKSIGTGIINGIEDAFGLKEGTIFEAIDKELQKAKESFQNQKSGLEELQSAYDKWRDSAAESFNSQKRGMEDLQASYDQWRQNAADSFQRQKEGLEDLQASYDRILDKIKARMLEKWGPPPENLQEALAYVQNIGSLGFDKFVELTTEAMSKFEKSVTDSFNSVASVAKDTINGFSEFLPKLAQFGVDFATTLMKSWSETIGKKYTLIVLAIRSWTTAITVEATGLLAFGKRIAEDFVDAIKARIVEIYDRISSGIVDAIDKVLSTEFLTTIKDSVKSIGENMILGIKEGFVEYISDLKTTVSDTLTNLLPAFMRGEIEAQSPSKLFKREVGEPIAQGIQEGVGTLTFAGLSDVIRSAISEEFAKAQETSVETATALREGIEIQFNLLRSNVHLITILTTSDIQYQFDQLLITIPSTLLTLLEDIVAWFIELRSVSSNFTSLIIEEILTLIRAMSEEIVGSDGIIPTMANDIINLFKKIRKDAVDQMVKMKEEIISNDDSVLKEFLKEVDEKFTQEGEDIGEAWGDGVARGIRNKIEKIKSAARAAVKAANEAAKAAGGIASPSRVAAIEVGAPWAEGIAEGIYGEQSLIERAAKDTISAISDINGEAGLDQKLVSAAFIISSIMTSMAMAVDRSMLSVSNSIMGLNTTFGELQQLQVMSSYQPVPSMIGVGGTNTQMTNNYNLTLNSSQSSLGVTQDFAVMRVLVS